MLTRFNELTNSPARGRGERGAALITALLMTTLLLAAGGALILTSSMAATTAADSTAEMQAYYAAEAGLENAVAVARHNVAPKVAGTASDFRTIVCGADVNCTNTGRTFSDWLTYNGSGVVPLDTNLSYSLSVRDASLASGAALAAAYTPGALLVTSMGNGPKGARKQLQMTIRPSASIDIPGGVTLRGLTGTGTGTTTFELGTSAKREYHTDGSKPIFVTTDIADAATVTGIIATDKSKVTYDNPSSGDTAAGTAQLPAFLANPAATEQLITDLKSIDTDSDNIKIVEGNYDMSKSDTGGILLVTGELKLGGNSNFSGIILVLGKGHVEWKGDGDFTGAMFVANYDRKTLKDFNAPFFDESGAGTSTITYSNSAAANELNKLGPRVAGIVEN